VKVITGRVVHDYFRSNQSHEVPPEPIDPPENIPASGDMDRRMIARDIDDFLRKHATERDRQIFWFYYVNGMTAKEIASLPSIDLTPKGVESVLKHLGSLIRDYFERGK
jgi:hypothetical protein